MRIKEIGLPEEPLTWEVSVLIFFSLTLVGGGLFFRLVFAAGSTYFPLLGAPAGKYLGQSLGQALGFGICAYFLQRSGFLKKNFWGDLRLRPKVICVGLLSGIALVLLVTGVNFLTVQLSEHTLLPQPFVYLWQQAAAKEERLLLAVTAVILAPGVEEAFFRGVFYPTIKVKTSRTFGILITGILFGFLHFLPSSFPALSAAGLFLTWLYARTNSLPTVYLAHACWNAIVLGILLALP